MRFLIDVNVISEATKPDPNPTVLAWLKKHETEFALDPVVLGEIRLGILLLPKGKRRNELDKWFTGRVANMICIPWDAATAMKWAELLAFLRSKGQSMPLKDSMIAATAMTHGLKVATRNVRDFQRAGVSVVNPFSEDSL